MRRQSAAPQNAVETREELSEKRDCPHHQRVDRAAGLVEWIVQVEYLLAVQLRDQYLQQHQQRACDGRVRCCIRNLRLNYEPVLDMVVEVPASKLVTWTVPSEGGRRPAWSLAHATMISPGRPGPEGVCFNVFCPRHNWSSLLRAPI